MSPEEKRRDLESRDKEAARLRAKRRYAEGYRPAPRSSEKRKAKYAVDNAIRRGKMVRQPCEKCGATPSQAHHDDYSKPLQVRWLCRKHHSEEHRIYERQAA